jgi:predicted component of type VI protein secretion system
MDNLGNFSPCYVAKQYKDAIQKFDESISALHHLLTVLDMSNEASTEIAHGILNMIATTQKMQTTLKLNKPEGKST